MTPDKIKPLPAVVYFTTIITLIVAGLLISFYLSISHYKVYTDMEYRSFCTISKSINCDTVSQSPYSIFLGVPVPVWGVFGYFLLFITAIFALNIRKDRIQLLFTLFSMGLFYSATSLFLGILSTVKIHSYCIMCIATYGINFMLLFMFWLLRRRYESGNIIESAKKDYIVWKTLKSKAISFYAACFLIFAFLLVFFPSYWNLSPPQNTEQLNIGITSDGHPWIGAKNPELTIVEFSDYLCFQCRKMHFFLRELVGKYPNKLRLVHRHFPMDHKFNPIVKEPLNPGSGILSLIAVYASEKKQFWDINDFLFNYDISRGAIYLKEIADATNLDLERLSRGINHTETKQKLQKDIIAGLKLHINGTPSYLINDTVYTGQIPKHILDLLK
jgi:protein-disulfide isomerase/uncharacterized membrane protein